MSSTSPTTASARSSRTAVRCRRITERFHRPDFGHLDIELTIDDAKAYTQPWSVTLHQIIKVDTDLLDLVCSENEKDKERLSSKQECRHRRS
jgi:hypothetical protein